MSRVAPLLSQNTRPIGATSARQRMTHHTPNRIRQINQQAGAVHDRPGRDGYYERGLEELTTWVPDVEHPHWKQMGQENLIGCSRPSSSASGQRFPLLESGLPAGLRNRPRCFTLYPTNSISHALVAIIPRPQSSITLKQEYSFPLQLRSLRLRLECPPAMGTCDGPPLTQPCESDPLSAARSCGLL